MALRKSPLKGVYELVALMLWWLSLILAAALWIGLRAYANTEIPIDPSNPLGSAPQTLWRGLAQLVQYVLPVVFLARMTANLFKRHRAGRMINQIGTSIDSGPLVVETPKGADDGVDLVARRNGARVLI